MVRFRAALFFTCIIIIETVNCYVEKQNYNDNILVLRPQEIDYSDKGDNFNGGLGDDYDENVKGERKIYKPDWADLDQRPLPGWYDEAKIGIFLHWGVFSVPSFQSEWFWYHWAHDGDSQCKSFMEKNYPPGFTYQEFAPMFKAEFFEPERFADIFAKSGAKYVVLTSKHHEGYTLFPSKRSFSWNSVEVGPHRDLVGDLANAVRKAGLKFGVYHSLYEWFNPIYLADKATGFKSQTYVFNKLWPDIKQLVNDYKPSVLWSDGDWEAHDTYWNSTDLLAWLYNDSPVRDEIVVNDRWGINIPCHHGDFYNCEDRYNPGKLQNHKWENAFTLDRHSWGFNRQMNLSHVLTTRQLLTEVASTVSCGGNVLINVGPTKEGTIAPIFEERLLALGAWLEINGEAIYGSSPWLHQNDTYNGDAWYTCKKTGKPEAVSEVFAIFFEWPKTNLLMLKDIAALVADGWTIKMLGDVGGASLKWQKKGDLTVVFLPDLAKQNSKHAWTLKLTPK